MARPSQAQEATVKNAEEETRKKREMEESRKQVKKSQKEEEREKADWESRPIEKARGAEDGRQCEEKAVRTQREAEAEARWKREAEAAAEDRATAEAAARKKMEKEARREGERKKFAAQKAGEDRVAAQKKAEEEKKSKQAAARKNAEAQEERSGIVSHRVSRMRQRDFEMERLMEETLSIREAVSFREGISVTEMERLLSRARGMKKKRVKEEAGELEYAREQEERARFESEESNKRDLQAVERMTVLQAIHEQQEQAQERLRQELQRRRAELRKWESARLSPPFIFIPQERITAKEFWKEGSQEQQAAAAEKQMLQETAEKLIDKESRLGKNILEEAAAKKKHQEKTDAAERMRLEDEGFQKMKNIEAQLAEEEGRRKEEEAASAKQKAENEAERKEEKKAAARDTGKLQRESSSSSRVLQQHSRLLQQHSFSHPTNEKEPSSVPRASTCTKEEGVVLKLVSNNIMFAASNLATALGPERLFSALPGGAERVGNTVTLAQKQVEVYNVCEGTLISPGSTPQTSAYSTPQLSVFPTLSAPDAMWSSNGLGTHTRGEGRQEETMDHARAPVEEESGDESFHTPPDTPAFSRQGSEDGHQEGIELFVL